MKDMRYSYKFSLKVGATIVSTLLFLTLVSAIRAQEPTTYNDAFLQYNLEVEEYNKTHEEYVLRRSQYIRFKTLQSENDAKNATVSMLQARDDVVIAYILTLKRRLEETKGVPSEQKNTLTILLDSEVNFFRDHKAKIPSTGTLDDLVADSKLASDEFTKANSVFYQTLFAVSGGKVGDLRTRLGDQFTLLKAKIDTIRAESRPEYQFSTEKMQAIDRFVFESENKLVRSDDKKKLAEDMTALRGGPLSVQEYNRRIGTLDEAKVLLKEAASFLREIVNQIKKQ